MGRRVTHLPVNPSTRPLPVDRNRPSASRHHPLEVMFRPCGFSPLRQLSPGRGCGLVPSHNRLLGPPRFQLAAARPIETVRPACAPFPATQTPFEVFPSSAAVPRHRGLLPSCRCFPLRRTCTRSRPAFRSSGFPDTQNALGVRDSPITYSTYPKAVGRTEELHLEPLLRHPLHPDSELSEHARFRCTAEATPRNL